MIPKTFRLANRTWRVNRVPFLSKKDRGLVDHITRDVYVAYKGRTLKQQHETLLHEMTHAVLNEVDPAYNREPFVEEFAKQLSKAILSARL